MRRISALGQETDPTRRAHMLALEHWLHDGLPLDGPVAKTMVEDWYGANMPYQGTWKVENTIINPAHLTIPTWLAIPQRDKLVPPASALALAGQLPAAHMVTVPTGHVGLVAGRQAVQQVHGPLGVFLSGVNS